MLSSFYLSFKERESQELYSLQKRNFYAKVLPIVTATQAGLTAALILFTIRNRESVDALPRTVSYVNMGATAIFLLLSVLVRFSTVASWFICPTLTTLCFYYFAFMDYSQDSVSTVFAIVVALNTSYFILVLFSEVWLISTSVYAPLLFFYMLKMGNDFSEERNPSIELFLRCIFCTTLYAIAAYSCEKQSKMSVVNQQTNSLAANKWTQAFHSFSDGVALIQENQLENANESLLELLNLQGVDVCDTRLLKKQLQAAWVSPIKAIDEVVDGDMAPGKAQDEVTVWSFIEEASQVKNIEELKQIGGPCKLRSDFDSCISISVVDVNVNGNPGKLLVVRDMSTLLEVQQLNYAKQLFSSFTERIMCQVQVTSTSLISKLQGLRRIAADADAIEPLNSTISEAKKIIYRVLDFEHVFNIHEGTSSIKYEPQSSKKLLWTLKNIIAPELQARSIDIDLQIEDSLPPQINTHFELLRTVVLNTVSCLTQGAKDTTVELKVAGYETEEGVEAIFEIICQRMALSDNEICSIDKVCQAADFNQCLQCEEVDPSITVAKLVCMDLGWHLEYRSFDDVSGNFLFVIPALRFGQEMPMLPPEETSEQLSQIADELDFEIDVQQPLSSRADLHHATEDLRRSEDRSDGQSRLEIRSDAQLSQGGYCSRDQRNIQVQKDYQSEQVDAESEMTHGNLIAPSKDPVDCLLISCNHEKELLQKEFGLQSDSATSSAHALQLLDKAFKERRPYRLVLVDLDDPTIFIGRIIRNLQSLLLEPGNDDIAIDVYACSESATANMLKKVAQHKVVFLRKPLTRDNCLSFAQKYPPRVLLDAQDE